MQDLRASNQSEKDVDSSVHVVTNAQGLGRHREKQDDVEMPQVVSIMQPILRFLQLLCENHNRDLQVWIASFILDYT